MSEQNNQQNNEQTILATIHQQLREAGFHRIVAGIKNRTLLLSGVVPTEHARGEVERIARAAAPGFSVQNLVEIERVLSADTERTWSEDPGAEQLYSETGPANTIMESVNTDFTGDSLETDVLPVIGSSAMEDNPNGITPEGTPQEPDPAFFAPTDPVIGPSESGRLEVVGGFAPGAMSGQGVDPSYEDNLPGDEALVDAISRELHEDALTTDLNVQIFVRNRVAHLRGVVPTLEDAENAEAVAERVPGVREVIEELDIGSPPLQGTEGEQPRSQV